MVLRHSLCYFHPPQTISHSHTQITSRRLLKREGGGGGAPFARIVKEKKCQQVYVPSGRQHYFPRSSPPAVPEKSHDPFSAFATLGYTCSPPTATSPCSIIKKYHYFILLIVTMRPYLVFALGQGRRNERHLRAAPLGHETPGAVDDHPQPVHLEAACL